MGRIPDSLDGIFTQLKEAALTMQQGGGIGHDFSTLRPRGAPVKGVGADASGPISFMDVWDAMCKTIMSAGTRRGAMMGTMRCDHPDIEAISFVGSTPIAQYIYETGAHHGKRVQALGGAKNHMVVMPDADIDQAVDALVGAGYGSAGERCMAISVVVAAGGVGDALVAKVKEKALKIEVGPGNKAGVEMGPLVTKQHRDKVKSYIDAGEKEGAKVIADGCSGDGIEV